jgi:hypothetical protein
VTDVMDTDASEREGPHGDDDGRGAKPARRLRWSIAMVAACALLGTGAAVGLALRSSNGAGTRNDQASNARSGAPTAPVPVIDMHNASPEACGGPVAPGTGHPDTTLSQIFHVTDSTNVRYLLGWQVAPYNGARSYALNDRGAFLALEPPTSGTPLGFGKGTLTIAGNGTSGSVDALVKLKNGGTMVHVTGSWSCAHA